MAPKRTERGPALIRSIVDALRGGQSPIGEPQPLDAAGIRAAEEAADVALSPAMAALFQLDVGTMRREYGWFDAEGRLLARPLAALVADHAGPMAEGFAPILDRLAGNALPLDAGSDSARFLYLGDPDEVGEYPVIGIDHDDLPELGVETPGFDTWLAARLGVATAGVKPAVEAANKRLFGRKRPWSIDDPGRPTRAVAGPAPGSVVHAAIEAPGKAPGKARRLTDRQLDKALAERAGDGNLARLGELIADAASRGRPREALDAALIEAAKAGRLDALRALLAAGASPNARDYYGQAISRAIAYGAPVEIVTALLDAGASPNAASVNGQTALFSAVEKRHVDLARVLVAAGANVDHAESNRMRPLHHAAGLGDVEVARLLLDRGADPDGGDHFLPPLHRAVQGGHDGMVALLLARGADANRPSEYLDQRPLHVAFEHAHDAIAARLVMAGADRSARDARGICVEEVYGPDGEDTRSLTFPAGSVSGPVRCRLQAFVFNPTGLSPTTFAWVHCTELVAQGLGGPGAKLTLLDATPFAPTPGVHELAATFEAEAVEPVVFELFARRLLAMRVSVRVAGLWIVPA